MIAQIETGLKCYGGDRKILLTNVCVIFLLDF
jgi:hypothetical protein